MIGQFLLGSPLTSRNGTYLKVTAVTLLLKYQRLVVRLTNLLEMRGTVACVPWAEQLFLAVFGQSWELTESALNNEYSVCDSHDFTHCWQV